MGSSNLERWLDYGSVNPFLQLSVQFYVDLLRDFHLDPKVWYSTVV